MRIPAACLQVRFKGFCRLHLLVLRLTAFDLACVKTGWSGRSGSDQWGIGMKRFIECEERLHTTLLPDCREDYVSDDNPVRVIEAFIDELDLMNGLSSMLAGEAGARPVHPILYLPHPPTALSENGSNSRTAEISQHRNKYAPARLI